MKMLLVTILYFIQDPIPYIMITYLLASLFFFLILIPVLMLPVFINKKICYMIKHKILKYSA